MDHSLEDEHKDDDVSKRPEDSDFKQQRLPAWQPLLTPRYVILTFFTIGCIFLLIGIAIVVTSSNVVEITKRYDDINDCKLSSTTNATTCVVTIPIDEDMDAPVFMYYQLTNFYQNHRRYVKSRSDQQLRGESGGIGDCAPLEDSPRFPSATLYPCGLIASSFFRDTFAAEYCPTGAGSCSSLSGRNWDKNGISWKSDRDVKFKSKPSKFPEPKFTRETTADGQDFTLPDVEDEDFIVWMRTAGLPTFKKLYRRIRDTDLKKGSEIVITIDAAFHVEDFDGEKAIVLTTTSWLGGKNDFLGWAYISVSIICFLFAAGFLLKHRLSPRRLGDMSYFSWSGVGAKADAGAEELE